MKKCLSFDDVLLEPKYSEILSRSEISLKSSLGKSENIDLDFSLPIISSPMDTVTEDDMACAMHNYGGLGIIHRYNSIRDQALLVRNCDDAHVGAAIGVSGDYLERAKAVLDNGANILCIDIAHGHHAMMRHTLKTLRNTFGWDVHIMAGNVATLKGFNDLADWGANSIRVGIGGGSICSTRIQTGHGMPTLQSVIDCSVSDRDAALIADGGIKNSGDIVKAYAAGADFVILGSLLASAEEAPGETHLDPDGSLWKSYRGMASKEAQINWRGRVSSEEGVSSRVPVKGPVQNILRSLEKGIRSGLSYSGCRSLLEFSTLSTFVEQTHAGRIESSTHIQTR
jgi:IMP dehydrogenase